MAVLVDTSVWIDLFRARVTPPVATLKGLLGRQELVLGDLILAEILQGVRTAHEVERVERAFRAYPVHPLAGEAIARKSAEHYRTLRAQGITVRKTIDCLIATWCIENQTPLLHNDRDFHPFARLGLREL
ncbi:MAG: PIN domain nuclease [Deferrisomatales bacterium]|nr:PIN domain nuclease [Deferrisomatales bacterium]